MRKIALLFLLNCVGLLAMAQTLSFNPVSKADEAIYLLKQEKYAGVLLRMDAEMNHYLDEEKLMGMWDGLQMSYGKLVEVGTTKVLAKDTGATTLTTLKFEKKKFGLKLVFNAKGEIAGMWIDAPTVQYKPASYVDASKFYEYKKKLPDPNYPAEAVLTFPAKGKSFPLLIIVGGSGPTDKDLTMGPNKIYKDLAWGLAMQGVAVLRYDKRTLEYGKQLSKKPNLTIKEEYLEDLKLALVLAKKYEQIDSTRIYVLGHSEGGMLIPYFEKNLKGIAGYVSFAGPYRDMMPLLIEQLTFLKNEAPKAAQADFDALIAQSVYARDHLNANSPKDSLPLGLSAAYIMYLNENSPARLIAYVQNKKLLFLQGGRDYQVMPSELELWRAALKDNKKAEYILFPKLNHLGLEGEGKSTPEEYENAGNLPQDFIMAIARFVLY